MVYGEGLGREVGGGKGGGQAHAVYHINCIPEPIKHTKTAFVAVPCRNWRLFAAFEVLYRWTSVIMTNLHVFASFNCAWACPTLSGRDWLTADGLQLITYPISGGEMHNQEAAVHNGPLLPWEKHA